MGVRKSKNFIGNGKSGNKMALKNIQRLFFRTQLIVIIFLAIFLGGVGTMVNIRAETQKRDRNLQNIAEAIACSPLLIKSIPFNQNELPIFVEYLDSLKDTLEDIDVMHYCYVHWRDLED